jgi:glycosyltransferase involved in cell wall biosynthesis
MPAQIAVVIPCYKVKDHVLDVLANIGPEVTRIYAVDDCCPVSSGDFIESQSSDPRVKVLRHQQNQGVGGAVMTGYRAAILDGMEVIVKVDGDGQMDPSLIPDFIAPILAGQADYTKGNRFFDLEHIRQMPAARLIGNAALSFLTKLSSGYWNLFDPTNGYTAIHRDVARHLPMSRISRRYFFETDMLFRLNTLRAAVLDIPMHAKYGNEVSNLKISQVVTEFLSKNLTNFCKRVFYNYYLRSMSLASFELPLGLALIAFGSTYGIYSWVQGIHLGQFASSGTVMLAAMPVAIGTQLVLAFFGQDISSTPREPVHKRLAHFALKSPNGSLRDTP